MALGVTPNGVPLAPRPGPQAFAEALPQPDAVVRFEADGRTWPRCSEQWLPLPAWLPIPSATFLFRVPLQVVGLAHWSLACESSHFAQGSNSAFLPPSQDSEGETRSRAEPREAGAAAGRRGPDQAPPSRLPAHRALRAAGHVGVRVPFACNETSWDSGRQTAGAGAFPRPTSGRRAL